MTSSETWPTTERESHELIEQCAHLKKRLTEYAGASLMDVIRRMVASRAGRPMSEYDATAIIEDAIYTTTLPSGDSVFEDFAKDLRAADRRIVLGWSDWIYGVFEVREAKLPFIHAHNLVDDLDYRLFGTNLTEEVRDRFAPGVYILSRAARVRDSWMLSGMQSLFPASERQAALGMAATLAMRMPRMFFRNPAHVERGRELDRRNHEQFQARFGAPWIVGAPAEVLRQYNEQLRPESARAPGTGEHSALHFPAELMACRTVGVIADPLHGIFFVPEFDDFVRALDSPATWGDPATRELLLEFIEGSGSTPATLGVCASYRPQQLDEMLAVALKRPGFSWKTDGDGLLREHNPEFLAADPVPTELGFSGEMARAYQAALERRSRPATPSSNRVPRDKRERNKAKAARRKNRG